ncbi:hypothetical protein SUGI_1460000 [Cryptomeria japonica]|uniref:Uncharacterized protein n=1 Tax=Cryptomeria japonica TaxID=3369 RepID=A0AAD3RR81_CRYJA|nr:hypothetical protein SUGI_0946290 [Cryptomeria japonica]GLJ58555.1 hypothetical protein SUGI_1460000 [Cryptomeria japonica]
MLLLVTILYNIQSADARKIVRHKQSSKVVHAKEEGVDESGLELNILLNQRLSRSKHSPAVGHMQLTRPHHKIDTLKNKLPSGPNPGLGNTYMNVGGVKSSWRSGSILKNKLPSGPSRGIGH